MLHVYWLTDADEINSFVYLIPNFDTRQYWGSVVGTIKILTFDNQSYTPVSEEIPPNKAAPCIVLTSSLQSQWPLVKCLNSIRKLATSQHKLVILSDQNFKSLRYCVDLTSHTEKQQVLTVKKLKHWNDWNFYGLSDTKICTGLQ